MRSTCKVERPTGESTDPLTGAVTVTYAPVYSGRCRVKAAQPGAQVGGAESTAVVSSTELHTPWNSLALLPGDVLTVLTSDQPRLVGYRARVTGEHVGDDTTAQRVPVERWAG